MYLVEKLIPNLRDKTKYVIHHEALKLYESPDVSSMFNTSNYPTHHPSGIPTGVNKKVVGMFKDEAGGKQTAEFVGLRAKLYSFWMDEGSKVVKKCKGVKKSVVNKT